MLQDLGIIVAIAAIVVAIASITFIVWVPSLKQESSATNQPNNHTWRSWADHPIVTVFVMVAGTLGIIAAIAANISSSGLQPPRPTETVPTPVVTETITPSPGVTSTVLYDFETGTQRWITSEGKEKLASLSTTKRFVHTGSQALQLKTELRGDATDTSTPVPQNTDIYRHTEAVVYFEQSPPRGFEAPGIYDLTGKEMSCYVYVPTGFPVDATPEPYIRLFVKDSKFRNQFSAPLPIDKSSVGRWIPISLVVGSPSFGADESFDPTQVQALGVRVDIPPGSELAYTGDLYIDHCTMGESG